MSHPFPADPTEHLKQLWGGPIQEVQGGKATRTAPDAEKVRAKPDRRS